MGCDIHLYAEKRVNGVWVTADEWREVPKWEEAHMERINSFYGDRNYDLFAILADVRNGHGFAGVKTGEGFVPISDPRGIPEDCSPEYRREVESWGGDGHSHSWVTLEDIFRYDWTQTTQKQGWVNFENWARWKVYGSPREWSGAISGRSVSRHTEEDWTAIWEKVAGDKNPLWQSDKDLLSQFYGELGGKEWPVTLVTWQVPYYGVSGNFWKETVPRLLRLGCPDDVRIVFFFDN